MINNINFYLGSQAQKYTEKIAHVNIADEIKFVLIIPYEKRLFLHSAKTIKHANFYSTWPSRQQYSPCPFQALLPLNSLLYLANLSGLDLTPQENG